MRQKRYFKQVSDIIIHPRSKGKQRGAFMEDQATQANGQKQLSTSSLVTLTTQSAGKYVGFALLMAWHYALWFVPHMFFSAQLLDERVTVSWLINLGATVFSLFVIALALGRRRHLSTHKWLPVVIPLLMCVESLVLCMVAFSMESPALAYLLAFLLGPLEATLWILWGERYACMKARFSIKYIGTVFGIALLACVTLAWILPPGFTSVFTSLLPLASGGLLILGSKGSSQVFPPLLPKNAASGGFKSMVVVCTISFVASIACYFLAAIIPWENLPTTDASFTYGILGGSLLVLIISGICTFTKDKINIFKMLPWLLVFEIVSFSLFLADSAFYFPAFVFALGISSIFEILLIMYFGILTSKGYTAPALAFCLSGGFVRAGIALGNTLAVTYEHTPQLATAITPETCLAFICVLAALLIPLVRREFGLLALTATPPTKSEVDEICSEVATEFSLSAREREILELIARGYTTNSIAAKLVISPYTVNTHIRHIYEKMQIHKRSELLNYINMQRSDF